MNKFIRLAGINASILVILIIISDLVLGDWLRKHPPVADVPASMYGIEHTYDASQITGKKNIVIYRRDSKGYRNIQDYGLNNIILTIGGSTTDQQYVTEGKTWQDQLDRLFANSYQFVNGGIDGQSTYGHLFSINNWHSKELVPQNVKAVVFYFGINDSRLLDENLNMYDKMNLMTPITQIRIGLARHSFFYRRLKLLKERLVGMVIGAENSKVVWAGHRRREKEFVDTNQPSYLSSPSANDYSYYKSLIYNLAKSTAEKFPSAKLVFVQQQIPGCKFLTTTKFIDRHPSSYTDSTSMCRRLGEIYFSQDQSIASLPKDNRPAVLKMYLDKPISDSGFYDYVHTNELGSAEIAQYLRKNLPL